MSNQIEPGAPTENGCGLGEATKQASDGRARGREGVEATGVGPGTASCCQARCEVRLRDVRFVLAINPSVSTLHSTSFSGTLHLIFTTRALQTF